MKELEYKKPYDLNSLIIAIAINNYKKDNFCVYTKDYTEKATAELICYLDKYPVIDDNDEEIFPDYVLDNDLELFFYGEQFEDVLRNILSQKSNPVIDDFIAGLNYYLKNDAFITL
ncbi:hypothetical protein [Pantoea sp. At-9b]|uniref:DUF7716 domain-containing protein n=1 Tax=Pantoea sp. (strain At-9b) TaxID=592316 RepID=UPI0001B40465|nr:hypothetical protein [Pantoea sp. At-9b]ADU69799.1 conserved hypothetical protein [Pantoea sp. At-9b]